MPTQKKANPKPPNRRSASVSTKDQILHAAEELFAQKGFEGTRTRDIADSVGVNISTLHFHWKSKDELHAAVYLHLLAERAKLAQELFSLLEQPITTRDQWIEFFQAAVDKTFTFFRTHPFAARLDTHHLLHPTLISVDMEQGPGGNLLMSVADWQRRIMPQDTARQIDVEMTILSVNAFVQVYFTNPAAFGRLLRERSSAALEKRVKRHVQQMLLRLYDMR
jgi:AcrR family transcriptional regulator